MNIFSKLLNKNKEIVELKSDDLSFKEKIRKKYYIKKRTYGSGKQTYQVYRKRESEYRKFDIPERPMSGPLSSYNDANEVLSSIVDNEYLNCVVHEEVMN